MKPQSIRGYSRANAKKQKRTFVFHGEKTQPRSCSWWTQFGREDFTAVARVMLAPETKTNYRMPNWEP